MKMLSCCVFGFALATGTVCFAQIDIYQSDAYSLEEMCAREAEQTPADYTGAYESCIEKNQDNPMYRSDESDGTEPGSESDSEQNSGNNSGNENSSVNNLSEGTDRAEMYSENENGQDFSQDQVNY